MLVKNAQICLFLPIYWEILKELKSISFTVILRSEAVRDEYLALLEEQPPNLFLNRLRQASMILEHPKVCWNLTIKCV